jgi:hypothetical protein
VEVRYDQFMVKNTGLFLLSILVSIGGIIGLAMGSSSLTGKSWQAWLGNDEITKAQQHIQDLETKLLALEKNQSTLVAMESKPIMQTDLFLKKQKILWIVIKLQQKFWSGESYAEEWTQLMPLLPNALGQDPAILELGKSAQDGIMTKHKLRKLLLSKHDVHPEPTAQPKTIWESLKALVKIERVLPGMLHEEVLVALEQEQLEDYIAHHPDYAWARTPLEDLNKAHDMVTNFYRVLDSLILTREAS